MSRIRIIHTTTYQYSTPVGFGTHRLVLRPREGHDFQVEQHALHIAPAAAVTWHRDLFGNSIAIARFLRKSELLEIKNDVIAVRRDQTSHKGLLDAFPALYPVVYSALEIPVASGYLDPVYPDEAERLHLWVLNTFPIQHGADAVCLVNTIGDWIHKNIKYRRREDKGVQTPCETLELRSGSCRDMATLMLEAVRSIKIASRFASGYLDSPASAAGRAATHAWMEVYFPEHGWFGYDPTLGEGTSHKHIVTGVSSHPRGVMPVTGSFDGTRDQYLGMTVSVKIEPLEISHPIQPA